MHSTVITLQRVNPSVGVAQLAIPETRPATMPAVLQDVPGTDSRNPHYAREETLHPTDNLRKFTNAFNVQLPNMLFRGEGV